MTTGTIKQNCEETLKFLKKGNPGDHVLWDPKYFELQEVQDYLEEKVKSLPIALSFDVTAYEPLHFKTLNYTTYAGFFIIHPLSVEQSLRQMSDAYADRLDPVGFIDHIKDKIRSEGYVSKYLSLVEEKPFSKEALVVLPGANKLKKHVCVGKLKYILDKHGKDNVLFKKHPISFDEAYQELDEFLGGINYASGHAKLFNLMEEADYVYSSMISETALTANILGKKVDHIDLWQNRGLTSFGHINYYLFSTPDPVKWADIAFSSYKSGVIHPLIDKDWKNKIDMYLDYIMELRGFYKNAYLNG